MGDAGPEPAPAASAPAVVHSKLAIEYSIM